MFTITVLTPDGGIALHHQDHVPTLEALQQWVGGWLEKVPGLDTREGQPCVAFCDEEGLLKALPRNDLASEIWWAAAPQATGEFLVGPVVIVEGDISKL